MKRMLTPLVWLLALVGVAPAFAAEITFFEREGFQGRSFSANQTIPNFADVGFNDRASSLRVEAGYWVFCSDANFGCECLTFGPGDYPTLPGGLDNRISSGRRIHQQYPYSQNPNWQL
jgi:hypothetical protein